MQGRASNAFELLFSSSESSEMLAFELFFLAWNLLKCWHSNCFSYLESSEMLAFELLFLLGIF